MYLKNVVYVLGEQMTCDSINKKLIKFNEYWGFTCLSKNGYTSEIQSYNFNTIYGEKLDTSAMLRAKYKEVAKISLMNHKYKILTSGSISDIYRIPRTFTIAYNETTLINASMRTNLNYLYWLLECKDVMRVITENLYNVVKYDYSLYTCAN